jgi:hypothetical protein
MTGTFCAHCGAQRVPGAAFCASCGAALAAPPAAAPPAAPPSYPAQQPPAPPAQQPVAAQPYPAQQPVAAQPYPAQQPVAAQPYPAQQPVAAQPYPAAAQPYPAPQPAAQYPYTAQQPAPAPWGATAATAVPAGAQRRNLVDALLTGDWGGAARSAGIAVGAMAALSLVGMLMITEGGIGFRETVALILAGVCLAVGGDAYLEAGAASFDGSSSVGVLPLTVTLVGLGLLGRLYARQLRTQPPATATDGLLHGVRTALVFTACFLPLSLLTRYSSDEPNGLGLYGRLGVGVISTVIGALLFAVAALGVAWLLSRHTVLPGRVGAFRDKVRAPLVGALAVFSIGLLAVLVGLVYALIEAGDQLVSLGAVVIGAGNGALYSVLWSAGVPLDVEGSATGSSLLDEFAPVGSQSVDLFTFTDGSAWFWLAPVVLLAAMVLVTAALAVRQNTIEDARREGVRFAGALAAVALVAALLLRIGAEGESEASQFTGAADASIMFNPLLAAVVLAVWGGITGLLAPVVAAKMPGGFVVEVRRRFGAAPALVPPPVG